MTTDTPRGVEAAWEAIGPVLAGAADSAAEVTTIDDCFDDSGDECIWWARSAPSCRVRKAR
jgi:hypothetical protein